MSEADVSWWLDDTKSWRRGTPPAGWTQGSDGRWHAPEQTTQELVVVGASWSDPPEAGPPTPTIRAPGARHLTTGNARSGRPTGPRSRGVSTLPPWIKVAVPALVAVIVLVAAGVVLTVTADAGDERPPADEAAVPGARPNVTTPAAGASPGPAAPDDPTAGPGTEATTEPSSPAGPTTSTTMSPRTTPSTDPASPAPSDPLAACSTGQRNVIERGNHPWEWYVARFDEDGDGILCT